MSDQPAEPGSAGMVSSKGKTSPGDGKQAAGIKQQITATLTQQQFIGPIPPPEIIAQYEKIVPGSAAMIMARAEKQADHRMGLEANVIPAQQTQSERGQHYGLVVALAGIIASTVMVLAGHDVAGGFVGGTTLLGMVGVFVTGKVIQSRDLKEKSGG